MSKGRKWLQRGYRLLKKRGLRICILRSLEKLFYTKDIVNDINKKNYALDEIEENCAIKVSIVVPIYNTPIRYLQEMIDSVLNQTYSNIELCLFNGGSDKQEVDNIIKQYQNRDSRVVYKVDSRNYGISENTNRAIGMATGDYIGLLDHDDILETNAVEECVKAVIFKNADVIYSDEDKVTEDGKHFIEPHIKPDWSPDTLKSHNYICHFLVFKTSLLKQIGMLRSCFDGSQDYDFIIRLTRNARVIYHIPLVLYHWRISGQSTAGSMDVKSYAIEAGKRVLEQSIKDDNLKYEVDYGVCVGTYKLRAKLEDEPAVTIVVIGRWKNKVQLMKSYKKLCINTSYAKYKVLYINQAPSKVSTTSEEMTVINICNKGFYEVFLEAMNRVDTEYVIIKNDALNILTDRWCTELVGQAQEKYIAIVGPKLMKNRRNIYSFGMSIIDERIKHNFQGYHKEFYGYMGRNTIAQNVEGISQQLFLIKKSSWNASKDSVWKVENRIGMMEICLAIRSHGYFIKVIPNEIGIVNKFVRDRDVQYNK